MVKSLKLAAALLAAVVLFAFAATGRAAEPSKPEAKSTCPEECQRRAKAALALAATKQPVATPTPKPKEAPKVNLCPCGPGCKCAEGCPLACPAVGISA